MKTIHIIIFAIIIGIFGTLIFMQFSKAAYLYGGDSGLLGWWRFDDRSTNTTSTDSSGKNKDATLISIVSGSWVAGRIGNLALLLDGVADYAHAGTSSQLSSSFFTASAWFKRNGTGTTASSGTNGRVAEPIITKGVGEGDASNLDANFFIGWLQASRKLAVDFEDTLSGANHPMDSISVLNATNTWYMVTVTMATSTKQSNNYRMYINGVLDNSITFPTSTPRGDNRQGFGIGVAVNSSLTATGRCNCTIDDVRMYNRPLSPAEVYQLYVDGSKRRISNGLNR